MGADLHVHPLSVRKKPVKDDFPGDSPSFEVRSCRVVGVERATRRRESREVDRSSGNMMMECRQLFVEA